MIEVSYSNIPKSKVPAKIKILALGAGPKGVFTPVGDINVKASPIFKPNLSANLSPSIFLPGVMKFLLSSSLKEPLNIFLSFKISASIPFNFTPVANLFELAITVDSIDF